MEAPRTAEIVSVGTELLLGQIIDTHAATMARVLAECGIGCQRRATVGDNFTRIVDTFKSALSRSDIVIAIGGLGPTNDDLTREAMAEAMGDELVFEEAYAEELKAWFAARNYTWVERNNKQAMRPKHGRMIPNPNGTAPGLIAEKDGKVMIALPGPKGEFDPMAEGSVREYLQSAGGGMIIASRTVRICGIGESAVDEQLGDLMDQESPTVAPYAQTGEVHVRVTARAASKEAAMEQIIPVCEEIQRRLGKPVYGFDLETLESAILAELERRGETLALAESVTGGGIARRVTSIPGASKVFSGGVVTYTAETKYQLLGVDPDLLDEKGPVSPEVATAMALKAQVKFGAAYALATTGNAGPTSDIDGKPVGLCYVALAKPDGSVEVNEHKLRGLREDIRARLEQFALLKLWLSL